MGLEWGGRVTYLLADQLLRATSIGRGDCSLRRIDYLLMAAGYVIANQLSDDPTEDFVADATAVVPILIEYQTDEYYL